MAKKVTVRQCVGCGQPMDKNSMIRVIRTPEGSMELDPTGKKNGRGAYLCRSEACLKQAKKNRGLERSFRMQIPAEVYEALGEELRQLETR